MIRTVALGVVCPAGPGAISAADKKSPPPHSAGVVFPVVAGYKADRLPIKSNAETPTEAEMVNAVYAPPPEEPVIPPQPPPRRSKEKVTPSAPSFIPRHWHDPRDLKASAAKPTGGVTSRLKEAHR